MKLKRRLNESGTLKSMTVASSSRRASWGLEAGTAHHKAALLAWVLVTKVSTVMEIFMLVILC